MTPTKDGSRLIKRLRASITPATLGHDSALSTNKEVVMITTENRPGILVVEDVHETRDGIEKLLIADGYRVAVARDEADAMENAQRNLPDLILVSLAGAPVEVIASARRIRDGAGIGDEIPVVVFCVGELGEGDEIAIGQNVHLTRPDNFNQLRGLLTRLLGEVPQAA